MREHGTSVKPARQDAHQMHQALESFMRLDDSQHMTAWSSLRSKLEGVGPAPDPEPKYWWLSKQAELYDALAVLKLPHNAQVICETYRADAVLFTHDSSAAPVILVLERPKDYLTDWSIRYWLLTKRTVLTACLALLSQVHGNVVGMAASIVFAGSWLSGTRSWASMVP